MRRLLLLFLAIALPAVAEHKWDPVADPKAIVVEGSARFTVLTLRGHADGEWSFDCFPSAEKKGSILLLNVTWGVIFCAT